jgi:hypothetical protein
VGRHRDRQALTANRPQRAAGLFLLPVGSVGGPRRNDLQRNGLSVLGERIVDDFNGDVVASAGNSNSPVEKLLIEVRNLSA